ncbi:ankyrin repeat and SAM domain-containing protein 6 [Sarotherodon galilaeus]
MKINYCDYLHLSSVSVKCEQLTQPPSVIVQPGQRLTITCQVSYSLGYYTAWVRQPAGKGLEWIGMKDTGNSHYKDSLKSKFSIDLDTSSKTVTLNGQNMQPEDTAVYYCARRHSNTKQQQSLNGQAMESIPSTSVLKNPQEALSLSCRGTGFNFGGYGMHWIRQPAGKPLEWLGVIWSDASKTVYASSVEGRIEITRDNSNSMVYLRLSSLKPEDSAVYYCAKNTVV